MEITPSLLVFAILSFVVLVSSLMVVTTRNLMHAALFLILSFFCVAGYYVILEAGFFAAAQQTVAFVVSALLFSVLYVVVAGPTGFIFQYVASAIGSPNWNIAPTSPQASVAAVESIKILGLTIGDLNGYGTLLLLSGALLLLSMLGSVYVARERKPAELRAEREAIIAEMKAEQALADAEAGDDLLALPEPAHHADEHHADEHAHGHKTAEAH
jgi:NADH:ubiquinone oxidoreductase subunit 6 (subunit J)